MNIDTIRSLLSQPQRKLISIIASQLQTDPLQPYMNTKWLVEQSGTQEIEIQKTLDMLGDSYSQRSSSTEIKMSLEFIELNKQLDSQ